MPQAGWRGEDKYKKTDTQIQRQRQCQIHKYTLADNNFNVWCSKKNLVFKEKFGINCASAEAQFGTGRGIIFQIIQILNSDPASSYFPLNTPTCNLVRTYHHSPRSKNVNLAPGGVLSTEFEYYSVWKYKHCRGIKRKVGAGGIGI